MQRQLILSQEGKYILHPSYMSHLVQSTVIYADRTLLWFLAFLYRERGGGGGYSAASPTLSAFSLCRQNHDFGINVLGRMSCTATVTCLQSLLLLNG